MADPKLFHRAKSIEKKFEKSQMLTQSIFLSFLKIETISKHSKRNFRLKETSRFFPKIGDFLLLVIKQGRVEATFLIFEPNCRKQVNCKK